MQLSTAPLPPVPEHQADSVTIIASPVSGIKYEWKTGVSGSGAALGAQKNVRIINMAIKLTWAVTQPTPLQIHVTIDNQVYIFEKADPVTATNYGPRGIWYDSPANAQAMTNDGDAIGNRAFLLEGRSVKIEIEITWATTQPTNLTLTTRWAKW